VEVKVDKRYPIDVDPARAWVVLKDFARSPSACQVQT